MGNSSSPWIQPYLKLMGFWSYRNQCSIFTSGCVDKFELGSCHLQRYES